MNANHPKTNGGRLVKRGDTFDPECHRTTHRLGVAQGILRGLGIEATWEHSGTSRVTQFGVAKHACDYRCKATWPEWVTGETFDLAYSLACEVQTKRGEFNRSAAYSAKQEREKVAS